jgi:hypothetical protein
MISPIVGPALVAELLDIVQAIGAGAMSLDVFVRSILDLAARTGIAPALLADYLTADGIRRAELAADIAEEAKLAAKRLGV